MKLSPPALKLLALAIVAAFCFVVIRLFAEGEEPKGDFAYHLHLTFPDQFETLVVDKETFRDALKAHSKYAGEGKQMHNIRWDDGTESVKFEGGVDWQISGAPAAAPSSSPGKRADFARHVAQRVGFDSMEKLEAFAAMTKPKSSSPSPGKSPAPKPNR
jgi:hypothetical protein